MLPAQAAQHHSDAMMMARCGRNSPVDTSVTTRGMCTMVTKQALDLQSFNSLPITRHLSRRNTTSESPGRKHTGCAWAGLGARNLPPLTLELKENTV